MENPCRLSLLGKCKIHHLVEQISFEEYRQHEDLRSSLIWLEPVSSSSHHELYSLLLCFGLSQEARPGYEALDVKDILEAMASAIFTPLHGQMMFGVL